MAQVPVLGAVWLLLKAFIVFNVLNLFWAAMPRLRIDQVLAFNWKFLLPMGLVMFLMVALVDKLLWYAGVPEGWARAGGLLLANVLIGLVVVGMLVRLRRVLDRRRRDMYGAG